MKTKKVNIYTNRLITALSVPIRGNVNAATLTTQQIFNCLCQKAIVDEILEDGTLVRLDMANYDKENDKEMQAKKEAIAQQLADDALAASMLAAAQATANREKLEAEAAAEAAKRALEVKEKEEAEAAQAELAAVRIATARAAINASKDKKK